MTFHSAVQRITLAGLTGSALIATMLVTSPTARADADGCALGVEADFNGDGRADAAVGDPSATVVGQAQAGQVIVLYGDADLRVGEGARGVIRQGLASVGGVPEAGDRFGFAIAAADLDCDGYTDLAVGSPNEDISGLTDSGYLQIIFGSAAGLGQGALSRNLTQGNFGAALGAGDHLGYAVDAIEDAGQGGTPAPDAYVLAVGAPGARVNGLLDAGAVGFLAATDGGNVSSWIHQDSTGIPGGAEAGDRFGASVTLAYLTGSSDVDAAVGAPGEDVGTLSDAGSVTVLNDVYDAPISGKAWSQDTAGVPGGSEAGDQFGYSLDSIRVGSTSHLAVGVPREDIGSDRDAGIVQLFRGNGTTLSPGASLSQDTAGVANSAETGDRFGESLAFARPGVGNSTTRLAVGVPRENLGSDTDAGMVQVFPLNNLSGESTYDQDTSGMIGARQDGDRFGSSVAVVEGPSERVLLIGVPEDAANSSGMVNVVPFGGGTLRAWVPGSGGVPGSATSFGGSLASAGQ